MNDADHELFEAELRKLAPARPPAQLMARLVELRPGLLERPSESPTVLRAPHQHGPTTLPRPSPLAPHPFCPVFLRWLVPATAIGAVVVTSLVWRPFSPKPQQRAGLPAGPAKPALEADAVEIDRELVASFDAIARLPSGLPVRLRCREWADEVVLRDTARGIVIEQRAPRLEIVPVSFETY